MKMKCVSSRKVFDSRVNPKMKWSAEALLLISEVTDAPSFNERDIAELIEGSVDKIKLKFIWSWLKSNGDAASAPQMFFQKLGFCADNLTEREFSNLKILLGKFVRPQLRDLETEKNELALRIKALSEIIKMTGITG